MDQRLLVIKKGGSFPSRLLHRFEQEGYQVRFCMEKALIIPHLSNSNPGIIILENWEYPELEEIVSYCATRLPHVFLIVLSKEKNAVSKVNILEMGADDYIEIPYHLDEVVARVKTHLRREHFLLNSPKNQIKKEQIFHLNHKKNEIFKNHQGIPLSLREFQLLKFLITKERIIFSRRELLTKVWGYGESEQLYCDIRTVDVTVRRVREKIEDNSKKPKHLLTKRGLGYYFQNCDEGEGWPRASSVEIIFKK